MLLRWLQRLLQALCRLLGGCRPATVTVQVPGRPVLTLVDRPDPRKATP